MDDAFLPDPYLEAHRRLAIALLYGAPDHGAEGVVEIRRWRDRSGRVVYDVNQFSGDGGYASDATPDLAVATLAAEILALRNRSKLLRCIECDRDGELGR